MVEKILDPEVKKRIRENINTQRSPAPQDLRRWLACHDEETQGRIEDLIREMGDDYDNWRQHRSALSRILNNRD